MPLVTDLLNRAGIPTTSRGVSALMDQLATGDTLRDYQHASRTFVDSLYRLNPKLSSLFHVYIDINTRDNGSPAELGMMAKSANLPKYNIQNKVLNAYNRKNIVQEKINYDPVTIIFHDDNANLVRDFWLDYYKHYYRDSDHSESLYNQDHKYNDRPTHAWGYSPADETPYINLIRIYSLSQHNYSSYTLVRPTITSFSHGQHQMGEYTPLEHSMTVQYEAVLYDSGAVSGGKVLGFGDLHYDKTPSPISAAGGGTSSVFGVGGIIQSGENVLGNLEGGNYLGAALGALRLGKTIRSTDIKQAAAAEFGQIARDVIRGQNTQSPVFVPIQGMVNSGLSMAKQAISRPSTTTQLNNINSQNNQSDDITPNGPINN